MLLPGFSKATQASLNVSDETLISPYTLSSGEYLSLSKDQTGEEQQATILKAAGRMIYDGQWRQGQALLSSSSPLVGSLANEKNILLAKIELIRNQPQSSIAKLSAVQNIGDLPLYYQVQYHEMLAQAYFSLGRGPESVNERIKLEKLLPNDASKFNNQRALWLALTALPEAELNVLSAEATLDSDRAGWLQLALIAQQPFTQGDALLAAIKQWQMAYPNHPGNRLLPTPLESIASHLTVFPKKIALLLPLSGPLAGPGAALKEGFMAALSASDRARGMTVKSYDTFDVNVADLYETAVSEGADFVVGPLSKTDVTRVATMIHPVPTLLLNDAQIKLSANAFQFGLSPSNEAKQVAARAHKNGYSRALVITPDDVWGDEVALAFENQWRALGGHVVDTLHYRESDVLSQSLQDFLQVSKSVARGKQLKQLLGFHVEATPNRRQDFDMIFLLAYPTKARQIMPLLKYYYAGDVPVYATSSVYGGSANPVKDKDLDGIIFCDMPAVFARQMASKNWPEQFNSYSRLYALGTDSFALTTQLNQLMVFPALGLRDKSGVLYLTPSQQIARILSWAQFKDGMSVLLGV